MRIAHLLLGVDYSPRQWSLNCDPAGAELFLSVILRGAAMNAWKSWEARLALVISLFILLLLPACDGTEAPPAVQSPTLTLPTSVTPPVVTIKQELEEQLDMLRALVDAEKGRGKDVSQAEHWLDEADRALLADDLALAREKLRKAGEALGVKLP